MRHRTLSLVLALLVVTPACTVNPVTGKSQLDLMGEAQEMEMGRQLYPSYTQSSLGEVPDRELQAYVHGVGLRLAAVSHRPSIPWTYNAVNDPDVNAYALPGGKISITRGLLARMESEDELAAVLGHETVHVTARHAAQQYTWNLLTQLALVGGMAYLEIQDVKYRELYAIGGMVGAQLVLARYSRDQERQSDHVGLEYMTAAGYNPRGMVELLEILAREEQHEPGFVARMFASHPLTRERIEEARRRVAALPPDTRERPESRGAFLERIRHVRETREAYDRLAEARRLIADEKPDQALPLLRQSADEWPEDGLLRAFLAAVEADREPQRALADAARAARDAPGIFVVQMVAAYIFLDARLYREALTFADAAGRILPDMADVELVRGMALEGLGRYQDAAWSYRRVRQLAPDSEAARQAERHLRALGVT